VLFASPGSAACLDEIEKLAAQAEAAGGESAANSPPVTRTINDPDPPAKAPPGAMEKARAKQDQGKPSGQAGADPRASVSAGSEEIQEGSSPAGSEQTGGAGSHSSGDAKKLLADAQAKQTKGDEAGCMEIVNKVKQSQGGK
jgi:hypothetical protein